MEGGGQREEGRRAGLSKAARAVPAEAVGMHEGAVVGGEGGGLGEARGWIGGGG